MAAKKRKKSNSLQKKLAISATAIVIIFSLLFVAARTFGKVTLSSATDAFEELTATVGSFPYDVQSNSVEDIVPFGGGVAVLKTDTLDVLSSSGKLLQSVRHNYPSPAIDINGGRAILFDRGGTRYTVLSRTRILKEETNAENKILDAKMSQSGKFAIAVTSVSVNSILSVYDTSFKEIFRWKGVSEYITDMSFSDNVKKIAVTATGVNNANPYSKLTIFDFKKPEPLAETVFDSMMLFSVNMSGSVTTVMSDSYMCSLKNGTEIIRETQFKGDIMKSFCIDEKGKSSVVFLPYGNERAAKLRVADKKGELDFEINLDMKTDGVARSSSYTCVLTDTRILTYNNSGTRVNELTLSEAVRDICVSGRTLYVLYSDRIEKYSAS
ncbi:MAG: hypothetical protein IJB86_04715 [Clostridia bacterium]|nr:hypothetical protein [Clostridia bacterium]